MFAYLSKKLEIAGGASVRCLAWSGADNFLACGCDNGLLKVLKIDMNPTGGGGGTNEPSNAKGLLAVPTNISMNQTLEGHSSQIQVISWNNVHNKLTTSDSKGLIVVWMLYKGSWYEEMVNNRNKSTVRGLAWSNDGEKICIVYEDGGVIVGSADGNRLWSKELKGPGLTGVAWSPDANQLLFTVGQTEVHVYDSNGSYSSKLALGSSVSSTSNAPTIVCVKWRQQLSVGEIEYPNLFIVFEKSYLYLMRGVNDEKPLLLEFNLNPTCADWSTNGQYFALGGTMLKQRSFDPSTESDQVLLFSAFGKPLHSVRVPTRGITALAWDTWSLRLTIGAGAHIYFANVRPYYKIAHYAERMFVYAFNRADGSQHLGFWDDEKLNTQEIPGKVVELKGNSDFLAVMTMSYTGLYTVAIVNSVGAPVDSLSIMTMEPYTMCLTSTTVVCVAVNAVLIWRYNVTVGKKGALGSVNLNMRRERAFHIDEAASAFGDPADTDPSKEQSMDYLKKPTKDPTISAAASNNTLVVMRDSGKFQMYLLPHGAFISTLDTTTEIPLRPLRIYLNCDGSRLAMLDQHGIVSMCSLASGAMRTASVKIVQLEKKDVWDLMWAEDNPNLMCIMEKTRMYIYNNGEAEEPYISSGYFLHFKNLEVTSVLLDELMQDPERVSPNMFATYETRSLRGIQTMLNADPPLLMEVLEAVEDNPHPHLYRLLARAALGQLNLNVAEAAFVRCKNYAGIQFVKRVGNIQNKLIQKAEVATFFEKFEVAEELYLQADRRDLATEMWKLLGEWDKVEELTFPRQRPSEKIIRTIHLSKGDFYAERLDWLRAKPHYEAAGDLDQMFMSYLITEDFGALQGMIKTLPEDHPLIMKSAGVFASLGRCEEAVAAYLDCARPDLAVDVAVKLNEWNTAMDLAKQYGVGNASRVLLQYARYLLKSGSLMQVVQLFKSSNYRLAASKILVMTALREMDLEEFDAPYVKKLFVLSGLIGVDDDTSEFSHNRRKTSGHERSLRARPTSDPFGSNDEVINDAQFEMYIPRAYQPPREVCTWMLVNPWRGAEALHFYILCQKYMHTGKFPSAARCALQLWQYQDILGEERVAALVALATANTGAFKQSSRALTILEAIDPDYMDLAWSLFCDVAPSDEKPTMAECPKCFNSIPDYTSSCPECKNTYRICVFSGKPLIARPKNGEWICRVCAHHSDSDEIEGADCPNCPLCGIPRLSLPNEGRSKKNKSGGSGLLLSD